MSGPELKYLGHQISGDAPRTSLEQDLFRRWMRTAPNVERAISNLCEIREAAAALKNQGHDIACWADDALKALGYER